MSSGSGRIAILVGLWLWKECVSCRLSVNLERASKLTCSKSPHNIWCCSSNKQCRSSKLECQKVCINGR
ncbi:hypothetical protein YC2023_040903 [Brassica napus]